MPESKFAYKPKPKSDFPCRYCGRPASFGHRYGDGALCPACLSEIAEERDLEIYPDGWQHRAAYDAVRKSRRMACLATERDEANVCINDPDNHAGDCEYFTSKGAE